MTTDHTPAAVETLFLTTIPGATPSKWVKRFNSRQRGQQVQLVNQDEKSQTLFLQPGPDGAEPRHLPQLGYLRWSRDSTWQELLADHGINHDDVHLIRLYEEEPVIVVSEDHLLAAWDVDTDGPVTAQALEGEGFMDPAEYGSPAVEDPLDEPEFIGGGERMAVEIVASGVGYTLLPASVARMYGRKDVVVLPTDIHPGWEVGLSWRRAADSDLIQDFIGVTKGRRPGSHR